MCLYESSQQMLTRHVDHHHSQEINLVVMCLGSHVICQTIDIPTLLIINDHFTEWLVCFILIIMCVDSSCYKLKVSQI